VHMAMDWVGLLSNGPAVQPPVEIIPQLTWTGVAGVDV
jgi:hypothetical protein